MPPRQRSSPWFVGVGLAALLLAGCNLPTAEPVDQPGRLPHVGDEPQSDEDLSDLQGHGLPDECLAGTWVMRTGDLDIFAATLIPMPGLRVTAGSLYFVFGALGEYGYGSDGVVLRVDMSPPGAVPETYLKGTAFFETSGTYTTDTGALVLTRSGEVSHFMDWVGVKGDQVASAPGSGPEFSFVPDGALPYECADQELVLDVRGPTGAIPMIFERSAAP